MRDLTPERLTRLLAMITYFSDGRTVTFEEAADHFGISRKQLLADINTLWVAGAPGYTHADLIDFEASAIDQGLISLREAQHMDRPLRLAPGEAVSLLVALNSLIARLGENEVLLRAKQKLQIAAGKAATAADAVHINRTSQEILDLRRAIEEAISTGRQVAIRYVSGRDEVTERNVDPHTLQAMGEHWVLGGWCHRAGGPRTFRLDRVLELTASDEPVSTSGPVPAVGTVDTTGFTHEITLELKPEARWVTEQIPVESVTEHGGSFTVVVASADTEWLDQLCLRLGESIITIHPPEAARRVHRYAADALELYRQ